MLISFVPRVLLGNSQWFGGAYEPYVLISLWDTTFFLLSTIFTLAQIAIFKGSRIQHETPKETPNYVAAESLW